MELTLERHRKMCVYNTAMEHRRNKRKPEDLRDLPSYGVPEAARYLGIPRTTLRSWLEGRYIKVRGQRRKKFYPALIQPADPKRHLLSFFNLVEAHVLAATRHRKVPLQAIRNNIEYLKEVTNSRRPLLTAELATFGKSLIAIDRDGSHINITKPGKRGQKAFEVVLKSYLERIVRDGFGLPRQFAPARFKNIKDGETPVTINPLIASGSPVVSGTGISVSVLWRRNKAGESVADLAEDYGLEPVAIQKAITYFSKAA